MKEVTLEDFCQTNSQSMAAAILGCSQSAVSQMIKAKRDVRIQFGHDGSPVGWYEVRARCSAEVNTVA